jgi:saccharopine dehydrogenase-like NADP-dependent oxidoreductase
MGSVSVRDLVERTPHEVVIGDLDVDAAEALAGSLPRPASVVPVDVEDDRSLRPAIERADTVLNATFMRWVPSVTRAAIDSRTHLVDLGAYWRETAEQLAMDAAARGAGCRIVPGCGAAPGLTNVLARRGADQLDEVDTVRCYSYITHPLTTSPGIVYTRFDASTGTSLACREGEFVELPTFGEEERVDFPAPYGPQLVHLVPHPEPLTLPRSIGARNVIFKVGYPEDDTRQLRSLLELGFDDAEPFEHRGARIVPRDFAAAFIGRRGVGGMRTANVKRVIVEGTAGGRRTRLTYDFAVERTGRSASSAITGTMGAVAADLVAAGGTVGVVPPESAFDPARVLEAVRARGFEVSETRESF